MGNKKNGKYKKCLECGKDFYVPKCFFRIKYCSRQCYWIDKKGKSFISESGREKLKKLAIKNNLGGFRGYGKDNPFYGKKHTEKTKQKIRQSFYHQNVKLENHPNWKGGIMFEPYDKRFNDKFKRVIRKRDNQVCMLCGIHRERYWKSFDVHHVNYNKLISIPQNCISLCNSCHVKTNSNRKHWEKFFQSLLSEKYGYQYSEANEIIFEVKNEI